jgi:hypothetical protein
MPPHVKHYQGRGPLSRGGSHVARVLYYLEVWSNGVGAETVLGTVEGRPDLLRLYEDSSFVLRLETGAKLPCTLRALPQAGAYEVIAADVLEPPRP